jgi:hypothetical protein
MAAAVARGGLRLLDTFPLTPSGPVWRRSVSDAVLADCGSAAR